jgi:hypothetical protein
MWGLIRYVGTEARSALHNHAIYLLLALCALLALCQICECSFLVYIFEFHEVARALGGLSFMKLLRERINRRIEV